MEQDVEAENLTKCWSGAAVKCDCGSHRVDYVKDVECGPGDCEVFRCQNCGASIHIALPD